MLARGVTRGNLTVAATVLLAFVASGAEWERITDLPVPNTGDQQTCCVVADFDGDGRSDFAVGERTQTPSITWFTYKDGAWKRYVIDEGRLNPEAGGETHDVDGDGDIDLILGQDYSGSEMWWWENPAPEFGKPWTRRLIKQGGGKKHHDQSVADYDGDGVPELASWNQGARRLLLFEIPEEPRAAGTWDATTIYTWDGGREMEGFPNPPADIDGDGVVDIVGGGRWFKHQGGTDFEAHVIDDAMRFTQCAVGQLVEGGRPEVVFSPGDMSGEARWYAWDGKQWTRHPLRHVEHGHTCEVADVNGDGHLDIFIAEMGDPGAGDDAKNFVWYGDGKGNFEETVLLSGQGNHEGLLSDFDGDGDLDVLVKPYHHNAPRLEILLNPAKE